MPEKRQHNRRKTVIPVNYGHRHSPSRVYIRDISCDGMFVITDSFLEQGDVIPFDFSIPGIALPLHIAGRIVRTNRFSYRKNICLPNGLGVQFENVSPDYKEAIQNFVDNPKLLPRPELKIHFEPRFCYLYSIDLSLGCENGCLYCHFSEINKELFPFKYKTYPVPVDITSLYTIKNFPATIFLSPASDPFTLFNRDLTHEVLSYLLPKGVVFIILTKEIIPDRTIELIRKYNNQFEGIAIGITNLNPERNRIIEPNCPTAEERLEGLKRLLAAGVKNTRIRMDPLFPLIDDNDENLRSMVKTASQIGINAITATYIFSFGKYLKRLRDEPFLKDSVGCITEKAPMQGGLALTVPLEVKKGVYKKLFELCQSYNIDFNTCGCKESRLSEMGFQLTCRNPDFYKKGNDPVK